MIKRYLIIFAVFLLFDVAWLGLIAPKFYKNNIGHLMADKVNFIPAIIFYGLYVLAILVFVVNPSVNNGELFKGIIKGSFLGLVMYATYDLTNMATLKNWPTIVTVVDLMWGTFVTGLTSGISIKILEIIGK